MFAEPPTQDAYRAATAAHTSEPREFLKIGYPTTTPINKVAEHPKKIATMRPPSFASLRKSHLNNMTKIMA